MAFGQWAARVAVLVSETAGVEPVKAWEALDEIEGVTVDVEAAREAHARGMFAREYAAELCQDAGLV